MVVVGAMTTVVPRRLVTERTDAYVVSGQLLDALVQEKACGERWKEKDVKDKKTSVEFELNGHLVSAVFEEGMETVTLASFLRARGLTGTKVSCAEGGCGACTVLLQDTAGNQPDWRPVNACLRLVGSCHGMRIVTAEGIGGHGKKLDPMQSGLADGCGSQCGFCSPGMVASGVALRSKLRSMQHAGIDVGDVRAAVEESLDGNICRCTGYLPIVESLTKIIQTDLQRCAEEGRASCTEICGDIEEIGGGTRKGQCTHHLGKGCAAATKSSSRLSGPRWESPQALDELLDLMRESGGAERLKLVAGNTGSGVAKYYDIRSGGGGDTDDASLIVDIQHVKELTKVDMVSRDDERNTKELRIGSAVTIAHFLDFLASHEKEKSDANEAAANGVIENLHTYVSCVANTQVRSVGTVGGNVCLASICPSFPSDLALALTACGAMAVLANPATSETHDVSIGALLSQGICDNLLVGFRILVDDDAVLVAMRVSKRRVNAHAVVNFAMGLRLVSPSQCFASSSLAHDGHTEQHGARTTIDTAPIIAFGGVSSGYIRATETEVFLKDKDLTQPGVLDGAMHALAADLKLVEDKATAKDVAMGLFYRGLLRVLPQSLLPSDLVTAAYPPPKPPVSGTVSYDGNKKTYPVSEGMVKMSAALQTSGEAMYTDDFVYSAAPTCLHVAHVLSMHGNARISSIDGNKAMALDSSVEIIDAVTLKENGLTNTFSVDESYLLTAGERVSYYGQVIALVVASSKRLATKAAALVLVEYDDVMTPITTIDEAVAVGSFFPAGDDATLTKGDAAQAMESADACVEGVAECLHQYHFYMETQTSIAIPSEGGQMKIKASTQSPTSVQTSIASVLGCSANKVTVEMKRAGGGYGGKGERSIPPAVHAAIACRLTGKPVSVVMDINTNMLAVGSRRPHKATFKAAIKNGTVSGLEVQVYNLQGAFSDQGDVPSLIVAVAIDGVYNVENWSVKGRCCKSNTAANTSCRGPAWLPGTYLIESIFDTIAARLGESPEAFKRKHFYEQGQSTPTGQRLDYFTLPRIWETVLESAEFARRKKDIDAFNAGSRFVKRGIAATPMKYGIGWSGNKFSSLISIYGDGTVLLSHAGCEIGQGIDVKCAQVCAYMLGCPIEMIQVSQISTATAANCSGTGGSHTSENNGQAVKNACDVLNQRLSGIERAKKSWVDVVAEAMDKGIDLQARGRFDGGPSPEGPFQYCSFGVGVNEVQVDLLTGEVVVLRTDLLLDCGVSLNPTVDLGQAQGGFVMGLGYMLMEEFEFAGSGSGSGSGGLGGTDGGTGKLISNGTWEYKPPSAQDIPSVLNVSLLKDAPNPLGFMQSKASGEPPLLMSVGVISAIRDAIKAYKLKLGSSLRGVEIDVQAPATPLRVAAAASIDPLAAFTL